MALRQFALSNSLDELPYSLSSLRTNQLKRYREGRQCALFCYGLSRFLDSDVLFAFNNNEQSDVDFICRYEIQGEVHYVPVQVKELVPEKVYSDVNLQCEIDKLAKYTNSQDVVIAFHLNRDVRIELSKLDFSKVSVKELWFFGALDQDQENWLLIGNLLSPNACYFKFKYPGV